MVATDCPQSYYNYTPEVNTTKTTGPTVLREISDAKISLEHINESNPTTNEQADTIQLDKGHSLELQGSDAKFLTRDGKTAACSKRDLNMSPQGFSSCKRNSGFNATSPTDHSDSATVSRRRMLGDSSARVLQQITPFAYRQQYLK